MPALLKSKSTRPKASTVDVNNSSTAVGLEMSKASESLGFLSPADTSCNGSRRRPQITVVQPLVSNACAAAAPTPVPPPVMIATLFSLGTFNLISFSLFLEPGPLVSQSNGPMEQQCTIYVSGEITKPFKLNDLPGCDIFEGRFELAMPQYLARLLIEVVGRISCLAARELGLK